MTHSAHRFADEWETHHSKYSRGKIQQEIHRAAGDLQSLLLTIRSLLTRIFRMLGNYGCTHPGWKFQPGLQNSTRLINGV